ncbi:MAG: exonuclease domain-containing protein [Oscillospiraceae bacterium]|nr:exonuclease domain-containing protein [Oscillospiraceae bacterium]
MIKDFFVVDLEFTQYTRPVGRPRSFFSEIIEIGAVKIAGDTNEVTGKIKNFVKPHFFPKQAAESMVFCMITEADMKTAIDFGEMLLKINSLYIPEKTYFVSWGDADWNVIEQGCARHALSNPVLPEDCLDLAEAYRLMNKDANTTGLRKATEELDVGAGGLWHTAYDDAFNTSKVLLKLMEEGWRPEHYFDRL